MRKSGILLHITSLPTPYGVGTLGRCAHEFIEFLAAAGQKSWQLLPLEPTGFGDSPYQGLSAFAGNPLLIDLDALAQEGLLTDGELNSRAWGRDAAAVDFNAVRDGRKALLRLAFGRFMPSGDYDRFIRDQALWLDDYALYAALKDRFYGAPWTQWPKALRCRVPESMEKAREELSRDMDYQRFLQYIFFCQWAALRACAGRHGVELIGDIPIYVPLDSAEVWAAPELFALDENDRPTLVAGVPPDYFSADGQLWGNPVYDWQAMARDGFGWWLSRLRRAAGLYDVVRLDHFRALEDYWAIPAGETTAKNGRWLPGPGRAFIDRVKAECGELSIIAEDLGYLTPAVHELRDYAGWPGMKILQFAFSPDGGSPYLPHLYSENCVCYPGTHDNETLAQWWRGLDGESRTFAVRYLGLNDVEGWRNGILRGGLCSAAERFICPMQDWLSLDAEGRMNTPGVSGESWRWRMKPGAADAALAAEIRELTVRYGR